VNKDLYINGVSAENDELLCCADLAPAHWLTPC